MLQTVEECREILPGFGKNLALEGKSISSFAGKPGKVSGNMRCDHDADWGKHVERVNCRLDVSFGFENHTIRGQKKMSIRGPLAFIIMLSLAVGWTREGRPDLIRSLVRSA